MPGDVIGLTETITVLDSVTPLSSVTVMLAAYKPGSLYSWQALAVVAVPRPSPKSHLKLSGLPST